MTINASLFTQHDDYSYFKQSLNTAIDKKQIHQQIREQTGKEEQKLQRLEAKLYQHKNIDETLLHQYQTSYRQIESLYELLADDERHHFYIIIPVADRPQHLRQCLHSLYKLCQLYLYGGYQDGQFKKIHVIIADDSAMEKNIQKNQQLVEEFNHRGLDSEYFGLQEQITLITALDKTKQQQLKRILGNVEAPLSINNFSHKGASITRNITYLHLNKIQHSRPDEKKLFYFIDSDQQFCINTQEDPTIYAINYFHHLNAIFASQNVDILTGKVVGDPPVSPAVMATRFQDDVIHFIQSISALSPQEDCQFHGEWNKNTHDAAYHDMSALFGFKDNPSTFDYHCTLQGKHSNADCLEHFSKQVNGFFHGEHLTRETCFQYESTFLSTQPARTLYTGNYIFRPEGLAFFISFASLKLRMAGPSMGRILKERIGDRFVSANLPMLHTRTVNASASAEFRSGVDSSDITIDLSEEFIKQYLGDIMLFTIEHLCTCGFPDNTDYQNLLSQSLRQTADMIQRQYIEKHQHIMKKTEQLKHIIHSDNPILNTLRSKNSAFNQLERFIENMVFNFGNDARGYKFITSNRWQLTFIEEAILNYATDRESWSCILQKL